MKRRQLKGFVHIYSKNSFRAKNYQFLSLLKNLRCDAADRRICKENGIIHNSKVSQGLQHCGIVFSYGCFVRMCVLPAFTRDSIQLITISVYECFSGFLVFHVASDILPYHVVYDCVHPNCRVNVSCLRS